MVDTEAVMVVQNLIFNDLEDVKENGLYFRGDFIEASDSRGLFVKPYAAVDSGTYFNAFFIEKWKRETSLRTISLRLHVSGSAGIISIFHLSHQGMVRIDRSDVVSGRTVYVFSFSLDDFESGLIYWRLESREELHLIDARYETLDVPMREVRLGVGITAFKRDAAVKDAIARFARSRLPGQGHALFVIDNGQTLPPGPFAGGEIIASRNLGGAGGFTRSLIEMRRREGYTHALFMDDDASTHMECIERTVAFLSFAKSERAAVVGAMLLSERPNIQFEAGAQFRDSGLFPLKSGRDLTRIENLLINDDEERIDYGAWWFFAFPLACVEHLAFPFFVRGDDILFSVSNKFDLISVSGIATWQPSFEGKVSPSVEYLMTRSEFLIGCLRNPDELDRVFASCARFVVGEARNYRYGIAEARLDAIEDVLRGPSFFEDNPSAVKRMAELKRKYASDYPVHAKSMNLIGYDRMEILERRSGFIEKVIQKTTRYGHLELFGRPRPPIIIDGFRFRSSAKLNRRAKIVFYSRETRTCISVERSLKRYVAVLKRIRNLRKSVKNKGSAVMGEYIKKMDYLQSEEYWLKILETEY